MADNTADERGAAIALTGARATLSIGNTIISGETAEGVTQCHPGVSEYSVTAYVRNAISDDSCPLVTPPETEEEDASSQSASDEEEFRILQAEEADERGLTLDEAELPTEEYLDALMADVQLGEPRVWRGVVYYPLKQGSPAIDTANLEMCEALSDPDSDLVDTSRPQGDGCDIGAFEVPWDDDPPPEPTDEPPEPEPETVDPPPTEAPPPDPCVHIVATGDSLYTIALHYGTTIEFLRELNRLTDDALSVGQVLSLPGCDEPSPEDPFICDDIPFEIFIDSGSPDIRCEIVQISDIDKHPSMNAGIEAAVEIWGNMEQGVEVCISGSGSLVFMDTEFTPPAVTRLPLYEERGLLCARINKSGTLVHVASLTEEASIPLTDCLVTTANVLRLRDAADGDVVQALAPFGVTLPARARTAGWFFVEFLGMDGWISAEYVHTAGICE